VAGPGRVVGVSEPRPDQRDGDAPSSPEPGAHGSEEEIDEAVDESFPASDAPQWWSGEPADGD